jgi:hypothetical protein
MCRSACLTVLLGLSVLSSSARGGIGQVAAQPAAQPQSRVLESLAGTWDAQLSGGSDETFGKSTAIGRVTRQWVANHKYLHEQGSGYEAFLMFDPQQGMYRAWYFHANGHVWAMAGRWNGNTNAISLSTELDENRSFSRHFQILGGKSHQCSVTWTDEDGRLGVYGVLTFNLCDAPTTKDSGNSPAAVASPKNPPPAEMKIFADEIGKWTIEGTSTIGEKTTKIAASSVAQWILGGQFLQTTTTVAGQEGTSIYITGYDPAKKQYRCWYIVAGNPLGEPAAGQWDEKGRTMTWKHQMPGDLVMLKTKQWLDHDTAKTHVVYSRQSGTVETTMDGTVKRQKDK